MARTRLAAALCVGALLTTALTGCRPESFDPTDPANYSSVTFVNDTGAPLGLYECGKLQGGECHDKVGGPLAAGERLHTQVYWGAGPDAWQVRDAGGRAYGWLLVDSPQRQAGAVYHLSDAVDHPTLPTRPRVSPHPDPAP